MSSSLKLAPQLDLFSAPSTGERDPRARHPLDATSWIEHHRGWLAAHAALYEALAAIEGWEQRRRWMFTREVIEPRLTAECHSLADAPVPALRRIGASLSQRYGVLYDSAWLNLYRDHSDSTSWHADKPSCKRTECIVPVLSLGETRRFLVRPKDGGKSQVFVVESGDLVVMGGRCQRDWVHAVPKETQLAGPRISVNFGSSFQATPEL